MDINAIEIWPLLAGLGLFLFGMYMLEDALKTLAGRPFKKFLSKHTQNPVKAVLSGALATGFLQSSTMVTLLIMSFTGAGIIGLKNGIGMIFGANIGTTVTGWIVALLGFKLNFSEMIMPFLAIGGLGIVFLKNERLAHFSKFVMGFSFMFLGLEFMKDGFAVFGEQMDLRFMSDMPLITFFALGAVITALIQSSTATTMIILSSIASGIISLNQSLYMIVGANLGTTLTAALGTIGANTLRRKVGWSHVIFNVINALLALLLMKWYSYLITDVLGARDPLVIIVAFNTLLNLITAIILLPFIGLFTKLIERIVTKDEKKFSSFISLTDVRESHAAVKALHQETRIFFQYALQINRGYFGKIGSRQETLYFNLKSYEAEITAYYLRIQQSQISESEASEVNNIVAAIRNAALSVKAIKDIKHNLAELEQSTDDQVYELYRKIQRQQNNFYDELDSVLNHTDRLDSTEIQHIEKVILDSHISESETIIKMRQYAADSHELFPSLLNIVHEITKSNELLYTVLCFLLNRPRGQ